MPLAGKNFEKGFLLKSVKRSRRGQLTPINNETIRKEKEQVPWWEFHGIKTIN